MEQVISYLSGAYIEENNGIKVTYNPTGSGSGIQVVLEGECDIGPLNTDLQQPFYPFTAYFVNDDNLCHLPK